MNILKSESSHVVRRQVLAVLLVVTASAAIPAVLNASKKVPHVLFVCQFGTVKSAIAHELFRRRASQRGISVTVSSRGITPEPHLASSTREQLLSEGIVLDDNSVRQLQNADLRAADVIVVFNPLPAAKLKRAMRDWSAVPSVTEAYREARIDLDRRIELLLDEVAQTLR